MRLKLGHIFLLVLFSSSVFASGITFLPYEKNEFSPALQEKFRIPFELSRDADVQIEIYTPDGVLLRTLSSEKTLQKGKHALEWDGKDSDAEVVADEAYNVVLKATKGSYKEVLDPRRTSGGVVQKNLKPKITEDAKISYTLAKPSRVLIRLGIEAGVMLRSLVHWKPKNSGKNMQFWDGYDNDHLVKVQEQEGFKIIFSAFTLADHTIITTGSKKDYFQYAKKFTQKRSIEAKKYRFLNARIKLMSPYYARTLFDLQEPKIDFVFPRNTQRDAENIPILQKGKPVRIKVVMDKEDAKRMERVKYEITFYDDLTFISEEEMGYVPISWLFVPSSHEGKHILSVNIASFKGHVGLKSVAYKVKE